MINQVPLIRANSWDEIAFGMPAWEILEYSEESLKQAMLNLGHQTIKVEPLVNKRLLQEHGFFYCDTLIVPSCKKMMLRAVHHPDASILKSIDSEHALEIFHGSFTHGRFHRDFNLPKAAADLRYDNWLKQLIVAQQVYGLYWQDSLAGFIGYKENSLVLHAVAEKYRGKGLSKYWWSEVCATLLAKGHDEVQSSISATNLAALNLYASLGFSFSSPQDVYHRIVL